MKSRSLLLSFFILILGFVSITPNSNLYGGIPGADQPSVDRMQQMRVNQNTGKIDPRDVLKAQFQVNRMSSQKKMTSANLNWNQVGPNNAAGQTLTVLFSNKDASGTTILTGGVSGGIWKSRNMGLTWHQMNTQDNQVLRVSSMVQTSGGTLYVATGKLNQMGMGIYRSDDDSVFTVIPGTQPNPNDLNSDWAQVPKLALNPTNGRIFAATNTGLRYSDDGTNWQMAKTGFAFNVEVGPDGTILTNIDNIAYVVPGGDLSNFVNLSTNTSNTFPTNGVNGMAFAFAPGNSDIVYASLANLNGGLLNLYKSADKGNTWFIVFPGNNTYNPLGNNGLNANSIAVFPEDPDQVLFGGVSVWHGKKFQETGSYNWEQVSFAGVQEEFYSIYNFETPAYIHQILFRPALATQFAIATDDGISIGTISGTGFTFQHMIKNLIISRFVSVASSVRKDAAFGGAVFLGPEFIPGDNLLNEPQNGVQINSGQNNPLVFTNPGKEGDVAWSMIQPTCLFYATGNVTGGTSTFPFIRTEDLGVTPSPTFMDAISNAGVAPSNYWENFNFPESVDSVMFISKAGGISANTTFIVNSANEKFPIHYTTPDTIKQNDTVMIQDVVQTRFFIAGTMASRTGMFMSKEALQFSKDPVWFRIANVNITDVITCISVSKDLGVLWAGTSKGILYRLTNITHANDSTTAVVDSLGCVIGHSYYDSTVYDQFRGRNITSIAIGADNATVLVTLGNYGNASYVYKTTNGLDSIPDFTSVQGDLPAMPVYSGLFEMSNTNTVILGTDYGVFSTDNISVASPSWTVQNIGTGNVPVTSIKQQTNPGVYYYRPDNYGDLFLASYGRGIFSDETYSIVLGTDPGKTIPVAENKLKVQPNPFTDKVTISYKIGKSAPVRATAYDLSGRVVFSASYGTQPAGEYHQMLNLGNLPGGTYIIKLDYGTGSSYGKAMKVN